jgi:uncharacterized phage infection (PIP) family protein YhgE
VSRSNLPREDLENLLANFATNLNEIRMVLRSISDAAGTVAEAITENLTALEQLEAQANQGDQD